MGIIEDYNALKKFAQEHNLSIDDPRLERFYQLEQDAIRDEKSRMSFATREARREGIQQGILQAALGMKSIGIEPDSIARATGLSINEIMAL